MSSRCHPVCVCAPVCVCVCLCICGVGSELGWRHVWPHGCVSRCALSLSASLSLQHTQKRRRMKTLQQAWKGRRDRCRELIHDLLLLRLVVVKAPTDPAFDKVLWEAFKGLYQNDYVGKVLNFPEALPSPCVDSLPTWVILLQLIQPSSCIVRHHSRATHIGSTWPDNTNNRVPSNYHKFQFSNFQKNGESLSNNSKLLNHWFRLNLFC